MLYWAAIFFIIMVISAVFGFTTVAGSAVAIAKVLFFIFLILFIVFLILGRNKTIRR